MSSTARAVVLAMSFGLASAALATTPNVQVAIQAHKEVVTVDAHGKKSVSLSPAIEADSGDTIVYVLHAKNSGTGAAVDARIVDPIPTGTVLVLDSVKRDGHRVEASLDGGTTWQAFPATVTRMTATGQQETVPAPAESYTTLRWVLNGPLQPGDGRDVSFKVRIR